eukprot:CAMPEP_0197650822 /NCGR_PEP_ID=MMETSP1338-20131121/31173_1 /TAXON_ID=43686 ORGANISM="Pelagodinium beii, Strain RCC1491" /NCGR_SAMPLE_ID=MMETSP1338 /ASSEMBLY_ACC=CAM_ASM_000754 /LENGTH=569 /DNA_ID=CAMNT_0043225305 /DNA_START=32 /DNA_END=1741 /DNA_ORIENTATION=+
MASKKRGAVNSLKDTLVSRYGAEYKDIIEAQVEGRLSGRSKLEREDLDAIESSVRAARKERRGLPGRSHALSRSAPDISSLNGASAPRLPLAHPQAPTEPRLRPSSSGSKTGATQLARSVSALNTQSSTAGSSFNPKKVRRPAPYGTTIMIDDDASERSRVKVNPKFPVPLRPKVKPMDHWDLILAFDTLKHRQEDEDFRKAGKEAQIRKFKGVLDNQMEEFREMEAQAERARQQERQDMLDQVEENKRIAQAEHDAIEAQKDKMKAINGESLRSLERRRKAEQDRRKREQDAMTLWLENENKRMQDEKEENGREYARKCKKAKDEMEEAGREAERRKQARLADEKAMAAGAQASADDAEANNRAAVQARMDQIERNCKSIGAEIAGRDARMEAELEAKIKRVQEESDRAAKEDADRRKADRDGKVKDMIDTLGKQMQLLKEQATKDKEDGVKQAEIFKKEFADGLAADQAKEEAARQARMKMDEHIMATIRKNAVIHPRDFGAELTKQQELAYNRGLFEQMAAEGFEMDMTSKFLPQASHTGKIDPFPSVGPYHGEIHPMEHLQPDVG